MLSNLCRRCPPRRRGRRSRPRPTWSSLASPEATVTNLTLVTADSLLTSALKAENKFEEHMNYAVIIFEQLAL